MAGYNDPGHPAGLPSEPSPRRLPAGDGSGATAQMEGLQGPGSLQPGFRQCCFPNLERKDARCKRTAGKRKQKPRPERAERKTHRGGKGRPLGRSENREPKPDPETRKTPKKHRNRTGKRRGGPKSLEELLRHSEAIERERVQETQGKCKTSEEVSHFPAPESVVEKTKNNSESNSYKILLLSCRSRRPKKSL